MLTLEIENATGIILAQKIDFAQGLLISRMNPILCLIIKKLGALMIFTGKMFPAQIL